MAKDKAQPQASKSWADRVEAAKDHQEMLPRLNLGGKTTNVRHVVVFTEDEPRFIDFPDKFAPRSEWKNDKPPTVNGLVINLRVIQSDDPETPQGSGRALMMRDNPTHGLTSAIASLAKKHGSLKGVKAEIQTRFYNHPQFGPNTKGFNVSDMGRETPDETP